VAKAPCPKKRSKASSNKNSNLYDLDNFVIQTNTNKSFGKNQEKKADNVFTPNFKILDQKFYQVNFLVCKENKEEEEVR
jgi:hypothetical protein